MNRYKKKLEDKKALKAQRLKAAKSVDGSQREIDARLHVDGRSIMEAPLNLSGTSPPPDPNQAVPKNALILRDGTQPMVAPLTLPNDNLPPERAQAMPMGVFVDTRTNLQNSIANKADDDHTHGFNDLSGVAKADHGHKASEITGLKIPTATAPALSGENRHFHTLKAGA